MLLRKIMGFNFELLGPIVVFDAKSLSMIISELYDIEVYPLQIISDKTHSIFQNMNLPDNLKAEIIILPFRYKKKFLT
jgi:hypothetical protein